MGSNQGVVLQPTTLSAALLKHPNCYLPALPLYLNFSLYCTDFLTYNYLEARRRRRRK